MKILSATALLTAIVFSGYAHAQTPAAPATPAALPANKADCEKAKLKWDDKAGKDGKGACLAAAPAAPVVKK